MKWYEAVCLSFSGAAYWMDNQVAFKCFKDGNILKSIVGQGLDGMSEVKDKSIKKSLHDLNDWAPYEESNCYPILH